MELRTVATAELAIEPLGEALAPTPLPTDGTPLPLVEVRVRNMTGVTLQLAARLLPLAPELDEAVTVRASVAGGVLMDTITLGQSAEWSAPGGSLRSGEAATLRLRLRLIPTKPEDRWRGRADIRQIELRGTPIDAPNPDPSAAATTPAPTTPAPTTPDRAPGSTP